MAIARFEERCDASPIVLDATVRIHVDPESSRVKPARVQRAVVLEGLTALERAVVATILAPEHPAMDALRRQFESCTVAGRQFTGHGFFTDLAVPDDIPAAPVRRQRIALGDVTGSVEGLHHGAGLVLFVRDGFLKLLEGFAYGAVRERPFRT